MRKRMLFAISEASSKDFGRRSGARQNAPPPPITPIQAKTVLEGTGIGDSIAVNGICLTVTQLFPDGFSADVMHETLNLSLIHIYLPLSYGVTGYTPILSKSNEMSSG